MNCEVNARTEADIVGVAPIGVAVDRCEVRIEGKVIKMTDNEFRLLTVLIRKAFPS